MAERWQSKKILVVGAGGREHALCWALAKSNSVEQVLCMPGNGGTESENKCKNEQPRAGESLEEAALRIARDARCDFAVIGPEEPLARGLADTLRGAGISAVGPGREGAMLEASKDFAKRFMARHGVACAQSETFDSARAARQYIETLKSGGKPIVVKADGLAAGKGVVVAPNAEEALQAVQLFMEDGLRGGAGKKIVIEEFLDGVEYSVLAAVSVAKNGRADKRPCIKPFVCARDHKRLETGGTGPNTGGMGAVAPVRGVTEAVLAEFNSAILLPTLNGLIAGKIDYQGFIFFGVMLTASGSKLLEYNARLGDPETQAVLPLFGGDFAGLCESIIDGTLHSHELLWKSGAVCAPVLVSGGYPASYKTGFPITFGRAADIEGVKVFVSGAKKADGSFVTSGGRVLTVAAYSADAQSAKESAYSAIKEISFTGMYYRADIGASA